MTSLFLGVDGGGTGCRVRIRSADGALVGEAEGGPANIFSDFEGALERMLDVARAALAAGGASEADLGRCHAGLGLAGADIPDAARRFARTTLPFASARLASDVVTACLGAHGGGDGGLAVIGTGTAYIARHGGSQRIFGGWGPAVSDLGSGADLGRRALVAALLAHDGLGPASSFTAETLGAFEDDPATLARFASRATPGEFGRFARPLFDHADEGDPVAAAILADCTVLVERALARLVALGCARIVLVGGLAGRYRPLLTDAIAARIHPPKADALEGALMLARGDAQ